MTEYRNEDLYEVLNQVLSDVIVLTSAKQKRVVYRIIQFYEQRKDLERRRKIIEEKKTINELYGKMAQRANIRYDANFFSKESCSDIHSALSMYRKNIDEFKQSILYLNVMQPEFDERVKRIDALIEMFDPAKYETYLIKKPYNRLSTNLMVTAIYEQLRQLMPDRQSIDLLYASRMIAKVIRNL